jgi:hypothetical protein
LAAADIVTAVGVAGRTTAVVMPAVTAAVTTTADTRPAVTMIDLIGLIDLSNLGE